MERSFGVDLIGIIEKGKRALRRGTDSLVKIIYPSLCISCFEETDSKNGLCAKCWIDTFFITGAICDCCALPLIGEEEDQILLCDACVENPPSWKKGRSSISYSGAGRRILLSLKHGDKLAVVEPIANWMIKSGKDILHSNTLIVPVPLHWTRLIKRKYNQAALLSNQISWRTKITTIPDVLIRIKATKMQKKISYEERYINQSNAFSINKRYSAKVKNRNIVLIDDVLTTGATLNACAKVCYDGGAKSVNILVFARVAREE